MQLSELDKKVIANMHSLPLSEQQSVLEFSVQLMKQKMAQQNQSSFSVKLQEFLKEVETEPLEIDTSIFDNYRKTVVEREIDL